MKTIAFIRVALQGGFDVDIPVEVDVRDGKIVLLDAGALRLLREGQILKVVDRENRVRVFEVLGVNGPELEVREVSSFDERRKHVRLPFAGSYQGYLVSAFSGIPDLFSLRDINVNAVSLNPFPDYENYFTEDFEVNARFVFPKLRVRSPVLSFRVMRASESVVVLENLGSREFFKDLMVNMSVELKRFLRRRDG